MIRPPHAGGPARERQAADRRDPRREAHDAARITGRPDTGPDLSARKGGG